MLSTTLAIGCITAGARFVPQSPFDALVTDLLFQVHVLQTEGFQPFHDVNTHRSI